MKDNIDYVFLDSLRNNTSFKENELGPSLLQDLGALTKFVYIALRKYRFTQFAHIWCWGSLNTSEPGIHDLSLEEV